MSFNDPAFVAEVAAYVKNLGVQRILEVGCLSGEIKEAVGADGIDVKPQRPDVLRADIRYFAPSEPYDLVLSSGVVEHYSPEDGTDFLRACARASKRYVLTYAPSGECDAYLACKATTNAEWMDELDFTPDTLAWAHEKAGLRVLDSGYAAFEWDKRWGGDGSQAYLVYVLAEKVD